MLLDSEQRALLRHHKILEADVLDAARMTTSQYKVALKEQGKAVALVETPCRKGHMTRLRLSSGHCIECSPQGIAHWRRHQRPGFVYIAYSRQGGLLKIGTSGVASERLDGANRDGYGGFSDWKILYRRKFDRAGFVESQVHSILNDYASPRAYTRLQRADEPSVLARELFSCDYAVAKAAVEQFGEIALGQAWES